MPKIFNLRLSGQELTVILSILILILIIIMLTSCSMKNNSANNSILPNNDTTDEITLTWYINFSWFSKSFGEDAVSQYIKDKTGVNIEYVIPIGSEKDYMQSMLLSGILPDIVTLGWWESAYQELIANELLEPINLLNDQYNTNFFENTNPLTVEWYTQDTESSSLNGNIYAYPNTSYPPGTELTSSNQTFLVRKDIYEAIGSPDMSTQEGFLNALEMAVEYCPEVTGSSSPDGKPLIPLGLQEFTQEGNTSLEEYLQNFLAIPFEVEGEVYDRFTDDEYISWLKVLNEANRRGLLAVDVFVDKRIQMEEKIAESRYFAMLYQWSDCTEQLQKINQQNPEQNYIAIDGPKNSAGDPHTLSSSTIQGWTVTGISSTCEHKQQAIELLSFLMSDEGQRALFLGIEGDAYEWDYINDTPVIYPEVLELYTNNRSLYDTIYGGGTTHWPMMNNLYADLKGYNMQVDDNIGAIKEWTAQYTNNFSYYIFDDFEYNSPEYQALALDKSKKAELLPALLLAETEEEFDILFEEYLDYRNENNYNLVIEQTQKQLNYNKQRLG